ALWALSLHPPTPPAPRHIPHRPPRLSATRAPPGPPPRRSDGTSATVCRTMPRVVPAARSWISAGEMLPGVRFSPAADTKAPAARITTTLLMTGVHIGAAKLPRALRIAPASELTP